MNKISFLNEETQMGNNVNEIHKIIEKILSSKDLYFWSVKTIKENRAENYFIFGQTESRR
jgi:hypothetical protein